jgi:hypothetical protein
MAILQGFVFIPERRAVEKKKLRRISTVDGARYAVFGPSQSRVQEIFELRDSDYIFIVLNNYVCHCL